MSSDTVHPDAKGIAPGVGAMQREDVDAAHRGTTPGLTVDHRGLSIASETARALVEFLAGDAVGWDLWRDEVTVTVAPPPPTAAVTPWNRHPGATSSVTKLVPPGSL